MLLKFPFLYEKVFVSNFAILFGPLIYINIYGSNLKQIKCYNNFFLYVEKYLYLLLIFCLGYKGSLFTRPCEVVANPIYNGNNYDLPLCLTYFSKTLSEISIYNIFLMFAQKDVNKIHFEYTLDLFIFFKAW